MPTYSVTTDVAATPKAVFALVSDLTRHGEWAADPLEIRLVEGDGDVGSRFESTARSKGKTITAQIRVTECDPPKTFAFVVNDLTGEYEHRFTMRPDDAGTHLERRITTSHLTLPQTLLFYLVYPTVKRPNARLAMEKLKAHLAAT